MNLKVKRILILAGAALALAAPAMAQDNDTLKAVIAKGVVMTIMDMPINVNYTADGKYSVDFQGQKIDGTWRIDGDKLCTKSSMNPTEGCTAYPKGKKSGDTFEVQNPNLGAVTIKIN